MENIYESLSGCENISMTDTIDVIHKPPLPPRKIFQGLEKPERIGQGGKSLDHQGNVISSNRSKLSSSSMTSSSTASSVVMALIKFYEKAKSKTAENGGNAYGTGDRISNLNHIPNTNPPELKINCNKIVSGGTNAVNFGVAPSNHVINAQSPKKENFHQNAQYGDLLSGKQKKSNLLKNTNKNNSMDEFLLLVRKTKQKYKDLLEKDIENLNRAKLYISQKPSSITNDIKVTNAPHGRVKIHHLQNDLEMPSQVGIKLNRQTSILLDTNDKLIVKAKNHKIKEALTLSENLPCNLNSKDGKLKSEIEVLKAKCEELKDAKLKAEAELNNVHLMSWEQLEKLQNLELKQDFLEAENNQMTKCIDDVEMRNRTLTGNIFNLTKQIANLNEDKKNLNLEITEKDVKLTNEVASSNHWKTEYQDIILSCQKKKEHIEDLEFELVEMQNLIVEYETTIDKLIKENKDKEHEVSKENQKTTAEYTAKIDLIESKLLVASKERDEVLRQNKQLEEEITTLELNNKSLIEAIEDRISKNQSSLNLKEMEANEEGNQNIYVRKLRCQLQEAKASKLAMSKQNELRNEKIELEEKLDDSFQSMKHLSKRLEEKVEENFSLASLTKENDEDMNIVIGKFKTSVAALSSQQMVLAQQYKIIASLETENLQLKEKINKGEKNLAAAQLDKLAKNDTDLKFKIANMEGSLEFEQANNTRLKLFLERAKSNLARSEAECANLLKKNELLSLNTKNMQRQIKNLKNDLITMHMNETRHIERKVEVESKLKLLEAENYALISKNDLANQRIESFKHTLLVEFGSEYDYNFFKDNLIAFENQLSDIESEC